ncbi:MAG: glycoside hydrolase family 3 C-terminal domain-containing protein [Planctomycetota bacterium]|nr:glycoside hydrolase family 3 C-terminal domain-containing protein [Planctomycetota bacterium]
MPNARRTAPRGAAAKGAPPQPLYLDWRAALPRRVADLIGRLTLEEKIGQMMHASPAIPRLGIPAYNWWNECLHGVARAGLATVFPQAIGMAASWNPALLEKVAEAISDEARAKYHAALRRDPQNIPQYFGLTFWTPNINIFRDPRWGRGQETYGEDPYLTGRLAVAFIRGLQGKHRRYLKCVATAKHYAVHSGPEKDRHHFDARVSQKDLRETYLPAFAAAVREARVQSIMAAYNRTNGEVCCGSPTLLQKILRDEWGFDGYVVSDCGAINDFHSHHRVTQNAAESAALAVKNGCDLECGDIYKALLAAVDTGLLSEADIDRALARLFTARFRLGMFDPPARVPWSRLSAKVVNCAKHRRLALEMARQSIVLLQNRNNLLPLSKNLRNILVVGPNAESLDVLWSNYYGFNPRLVTALEGILGKVSPATQVNYCRGCDVAGTSKYWFGMAQWMAAAADVVIAVLGLSPRLEGEEGDAIDSEMNGDRIHLGLPAIQEELLRQLAAAGKPIVLVLLNGSALAIPWAKDNVDAIVEAWYPGEEGGTAIADVLFGDYNPAGRLPITFYRSENDLPPFDDYAMSGRTYRYFRGEPLFPFGHGLSYTRFAYSDLALPAEIKAGQTLHLRVGVRNVGDRDGDEVVQVYLTHLATPNAPLRSLVGFARVHLRQRESKRLQFALSPEALMVVDENGKSVFAPGQIGIFVGGGQPNTGAPGISGVVTIC